MPADSVQFLSRDELLEIHARLIERFGGEAHPFLIGLLEAGQCSYDNLLPWIRRSIVSL